MDTANSSNKDDHRRIAREVVERRRELLRKLAEADRQLEIAREIMAEDADVLRKLAE